MPPGTKTRRVANENDENSSAATTRMTRAKAAALNVDELAMPQKGLQSKKTTSTSAVQNPQRKRAALGDVSNVTKVDANQGKKAVAKPALISKSTQSTAVHKTTQPAGVQKPAPRSTTTTTRPPLAARDTTKKTEVKRSGSGAINAVQKRKVPSTSTSNATTKGSSAPVSAEGEPVRKKVHTLEADKKIRSEAKPEPKTAAASAPTATRPEPKQPVAKQEVKAEPKAGKTRPVEPTPPAEPVSEPQQTYQTSLAEYPEGVKDLDTEDLDDPLMVAEYANEIFEYLHDLEVKSVPNPEYMEHQDDLEWKTRGILVDWLIEVHTRFHLLPETLFLAVNIIDRFLSEKVVQLDRLQLVGITAMFTASKYEEVLSPHVSNFRLVADDGFTESEILSAERFILGTLNFDLSYPNPMNFLRRISKADNYDIQCRTIGKYLMEISLLDHRFMYYRPSHVAAASMYMARLMLDRGEWDETLSYYAGYTEEDIQPVFELMVDYLARPIIHEAFFKKYASKKFLKASILTRSWAKKNAAYYGVYEPELPLDQIS